MMMYDDHQCVEMVFSELNIKIVIISERYTYNT